MLVAVGRVPNSDELDVAAGGIAVDEHGNVATDDRFATNVPGVWAIGDLANHFQLKHVANAEIQFVMHNILHPDEHQPLADLARARGRVRRPAGRVGRSDRAGAARAKVVATW